MFKRKTLFLALTIATASALHAQDTSTLPGGAERGARPVVAGLISYQSNFSPGSTDVNPEFDPIVLLPVGDKFLVASEYNMTMDLTNDQGSGWGPAVVDHGFEYLQASYFATKWLTVVGGRYLTPFGIYRERLHPLWIRNLQLEPILFALNDNSGNGGMLRGSAHLSNSLDVTYAAYFSAPSTNPQLPSDKQAGGRGSLFWPSRGLEVGVSYSDTMSGIKHKMLGGDFTWVVKRSPLVIRAEAVHSKEAGNAYWAEAAYGLQKLSRKTLVRNTQVVLRTEQYWTPSTPINMELADSMGGMGGLAELPDVNTKRAAFGLNYYLTRDVRFNVAYGGNWATGENSHTWNIGVVYHFAY